MEHTFLIPLQDEVELDEPDCTLKESRGLEQHFDCSHELHNKCCHCSFVG